MTNPLKSETRKEYKEEERKYYRNIGSPKFQGKSAADKDLIDQQLPQAAEEAKLLDYYEKGFSKTARSGAFTDKPNASAAIFPNGLSNAIEFLEKECTPKHFKPPVDPKPPSEQVAPTGNAPKARVVITDLCLDCMKAVNPADVALSVCIIEEQDSAKCAAMGVRYGDICLNLQCMTCFEAQQKLGQSAVPLALVFNGGLTDPREIELAQKYGAPIRLHDGEERTLGQWYMGKRAERLNRNLRNYLYIEHMKPDSPVFRDI